MTSGQAHFAAMSDICLVGHPYAPIGRGEDVRCTFRALRSIGGPPSLLDIYKLHTPDPSSQREFVPFTTASLGTTNVFHLNGDEVDQVLALLPIARTKDTRNIIYPAWELSNFPKVWIKQLERFDEIWAPSAFIANSIRPLTDTPVVLMPLACEVRLTSFLGRRYFGLPESSYLFLFFYDVRSYNTRKNPGAVLEAFRRFLKQAPASDSGLVIKVNGSQLNPSEFQSLKDAASDLADRIIFIDNVMSDNEIKNLIRCCDCFVSLHRSEGFGRGIAEAMSLARPVIATAYSGNTDFMTPDVAYPVRHSLIPVGDGEYPHWQDQVWADPDIDEAAHYMVQVCAAPEVGRRIGKLARAHMLRYASYRVSGSRYASRLRDQS